MTRGCRIAWPPTTRPARGSNTGRLSGCAIVPTRRAAAPRGSRVSEIKRDDVAHAGRRHRRCPSGEQDGRAGGAAKQGVELVKLAAFALPAHPYALRSVPATFPMEQQEAGAAAWGLAVTGVQAVDAGDGGGQHGLVAGGALARSIQPVREQREAQIAIGVREEVDLQEAHERLGVRIVGQERRDHHECPEVRRHAALQLQSRQRPWSEEMCNQPVDHRDGDVRRRDQGSDRQKQQERDGRPAYCRVPQGQCKDHRRDQREGPQVARRGSAYQGTPQAFGARDVAPQRLLEQVSPVGDQIVARLTAATCSGPRSCRPRPAPRPSVPSAHPAPRGQPGPSPCGRRALPSGPSAGPASR